ncbi:MAG: F0F1 ATP synthase subunit delta [Rhodospirillaceae bacterium]|nr:F0F1 ATP synthase subunit delta [Rhodospirillaceae bacterium]
MSAESMGATGLAGRYATALFDLAEADDQLDRVSDDLGQLGRMIEESGDLTRLIRSPAISRQDQGWAMAAILEKAKISGLTRNFVGTVAKNRRLFALSAMIAAYQGLLAQHRGESTAEVVSARPLTKKQIERIGGSLKKAIGSKVAVDAKVDPGLLGGLVIKIGSRMVDSSIRTKLMQLRLSMKGIG